MTDQLIHEIEAGRQRGDHVGVQVYASIHGKTQIDLAMGEARPSPGVALTTGSLGLWMSAGKPVTAIAMAQLLDAGLVELDDPVAEYLPGFERHGKAGITLRHVLTHTGGFRAADVNYPADPWEKTVEAVGDARLEPGWVPGERAGYHVHTGWYALGAVIESACGEAFPQYLRRHILEPLGMHDCWITMPREVYRQLGGRRTVMPDTSSDTVKPAGCESEDWCAGVRPGGNAYGPANQLARFYEMLIDLSAVGRGGLGELDGAKILSPETARLFTQRHRQGMKDRTFGHVMDWGLGFILPPEESHPPEENHAPEESHAPENTAPYGYGPHASEQTFGHGGSQCAVGLADPAHGLVAVVLFNGQPGEPRHQRRLTQTLAALYADLGLASA